MSHRVLLALLMTNSSFGSLTWLGLTICFQQMRRLSEIGGKMKCLYLHETSKYGTIFLRIIDTSIQT
jgi:hypothetical protein